MINEPCPKCGCKMGLRGPVWQPPPLGELRASYKCPSCAAALKPYTPRKERWFQLLFATGMLATLVAALFTSDQAGSRWLTYLGFAAATLCAAGAVGVLYMALFARHFRLSEGGEMRPTSR